MATKTREIAKSALASKAIPGLYGKGLIRLGKESRLELRDRLHMPRVVFGRVVNVSERTIAKVESAAEQVGKLRRPYNEVFRLFQALSEVVKPETLGAWFMTPNEAFDGLKPIEVIERGEIDRLWKMVFRLRSGMPG
jgi:hypothetical protein